MIYFGLLGRVCTQLRGYPIQKNPLVIAKGVVGWEGVPLCAVADQGTDWETCAGFYSNPLGLPVESFGYTVKEDYPVPTGTKGE